MSELEIMLPSEISPPFEDLRTRPTSRAVDGDPSGDEGPIDGDKQLMMVNEEPGRRRRHRRGKAKKRKWRPYYKLSWSERRELEEVEAKRANMVRATMFAHGQPVAPYNTTQFLMEDRNTREPNYEHVPHRNIRETSADSSDDFYSSPEDEEDFLQRQFSEVYEDIHAERLNAMSKTDLVREYMQLEERVQQLESQLKDNTKCPCNEESCRTNEKSVKNEEESTVAVSEEEISKLKAENDRLRTENESLSKKAVPSS